MNPPAARLRRAAVSGPPLRVLLLHGLGGSQVVWDALAAHAPGRLELWDADLPWTAGLGSHRMRGTDPAAWVLRALTAVEGGADVLVAHSFAAAVVLDLQTRAAAPAVRAAVLVSPFYRPSEADFDWATIAHYLNGFHRILEEGIRVQTGGRLPPDIQESMALRQRERVGPYGWMNFFSAYLRTPSLDLDKVSVPVLLISGDHDFAAPPEDAKALAKALPNAVHEPLPDCGHFPMTERPDRLAMILGRFLDSALPPTRAGTTDAHLE